MTFLIVTVAWAAHTRYGTRLGAFSRLRSTCWGSLGVCALWLQASASPPSCDTGSPTPTGADARPQDGAGLWRGVGGCVVSRAAFRDLGLLPCQERFLGIHQSCGGAQSPRRGGGQAGSQKSVGAGRALMPSVSSLPTWRQHLQVGVPDAQGNRAPLRHRHSH